MAGAFGYQSETYDVSMAIGALDLLPALAAAPENAIIVADGTSCRAQIAHATRRKAEHVAIILARALAAA